MSRRIFRIGIDVGGTFTDLVLLDTRTGSLTYFKEPSTPSEPSRAVAQGIQGLLAKADVAAGEVELVVHGTTLGLNTIIQRRGARVALVVSSGNRDVLEIARIQMPEPLDIFGRRLEPLIPRDLVFEVSARVQVNGSVISRPDARELSSLAERLKAEKVDAVAVMLLNSYSHPALEVEVAAALRDLLPGVLVSESAAIWPAIREYERAMVVALNAYIHPLMNDYFVSLSGRLAEIGLDAPLYITANNGGTIGVRTARERPIDTVLSGPSSGVVASCRVAAASGVAQFTTFDMGGTSSDVALTVGARPQYASHTLVGDFPLILPVVNVSAIGAGGGSVVWMDEYGILKVGPQSAGADPGPVCYGRGGTEPTITDCYLALGLLHEDGFLGGRMKLDREAARAALAPIGRSLGHDEADAACFAAEAALRVASAKMATEVLRVFAQRGHDPRDFPLLAYGGAGPMHANLLADELSLTDILIPPSPGTLCALGAVTSDLKRDFVRVTRRLLNTAARPVLEESARDLRAEASAWIANEGEVAGNAVADWSAEMRYKSAGSSLMVEIADSVIASMDVEALGAAFHTAHEKLFGFRDLDDPIEILALQVQVLSRRPEGEWTSGTGPSEPAPERSRRPVFLKGEWRQVGVYHRTDLRTGHEISGPALIEQDDSTTWLLPGWDARVNGAGVVVVRKAA